MSDAQGSPLADAMNRLWAKYLPQMEERVGTLKKAAESLEIGTLTKTGQEQAGADAHKLAGVLGTFGLKKVRNWRAKRKLCTAIRLTETQQSLRAFERLQSNCGQ